MPVKKSTVVEVVGVRATTYAAVGEVVVLARTPRVQGLIDSGFLAETHPAFTYGHDVAPGLKVTEPVASDTADSEESS